MAVLPAGCGLRALEDRGEGLSRRSRQPAVWLMAPADFEPQLTTWYIFFTAMVFLRRVRSAPFHPSTKAGAFSRRFATRHPHAEVSPPGHAAEVKSRQHYPDRRSSIRRSSGHRANETYAGGASRCTGALGLLRNDELVNKPKASPRPNASATMITKTDL